jgi:hypothetical protein
MATWYIYPRFGLLHQEKSGNPEPGHFPTILFDIGSA